MREKEKNSNQRQEVVIGLKSFQTALYTRLDCSYTDVERYRGTVVVVVVVLEAKTQQVTNKKSLDVKVHLT